MIDHKEYLQSKIDEINANLRKYMEISGIQIVNSQFRCPNGSAHSNNDSNPSACLYIGSDGTQKWYCYRCGAGWTTFYMAHHIEGLPVYGPEFITKSIPTLASKLGIEYNPDSALSDEEKQKLLMHYGLEDIMKAAIENIKHIHTASKDHPIVKFMEDKGLTIQDTVIYGMGNLPLGEAIRILKNKDIEEDTRYELSVSTNLNISNMLFSSNSLIFVIRNRYGLPIALAARNTAYMKGSSGAKYVNSKNSRIFTKGAVLYNLHLAAESAQRENNIYIVEGYTDAITMHKHGIHNVCAIGSVSFTDNHLNTILKLEIDNITFCLDGDRAGRDAMIKQLTTIFSQFKSVSPFVVELPEEDDPDSFIRTKGIQAFRDIPRLNIVAYTMITTFRKASTNEQVDLEDKIESFIKWLVEYEPSHVRRIRYIPKLAEITGHSESDLKKQLDYYEHIMSDKIAKQTDTIWYDMLKNGRKTQVLSERIQIVDKARNAMIELVPEQNQDVSKNQRDNLEVLESQLSTANVCPIKFGWPQFDKNILIPKDASLVVVGAYPNVGKSIMMRDMCLNIIRNNADLGVIYFSMDDPKKQTIPALIANIVKIPINDIRYQNMIRPEVRSQRLQYIKQGFQVLKDLIDEERLAIFDQSDITSTGEMETNIGIIAEKMSRTGRKPVVIIDSLHSVTDPTATTGLRMDVMHHIRMIKRMSNVYQIPIISVVELRKRKERGSPNIRPTLQDISETIDIEYRVTVGIILHNQLAVNKQTNRYWVDPTVGSTRRLPIQELYVDKNKEEYFKGEIFFKTNPIFSNMMEMPESEKIEIMRRESSRDTSGSDV